MFFVDLCELVVKNDLPAGETVREQGQTGEVIAWWISMRHC